MTDFEKWLREYEVKCIATVEDLKNSIIELYGFEDFRTIRFFELCKEFNKSAEYSELLTKCFELLCCDNPSNTNVNIEDNTGFEWGTFALLA